MSTPSPAARAVPGRAISPTGEGLSAAMHPGFVCALCQGCGCSVWHEDLPDYEYPLPQHTTLVRCLSCDVVQQSPLPRADELAAFYPRDYHAYHYHGSWLADALKRRYSRGLGREIRDCIGSRGAILDIGCADGSFLAALESMGDWELDGIDINPEVLSKPRSSRLRLRAGQLESGTYLRQSFDAIVATHLIEHVCDPLDFLRICAGLLRPGGVMIGELPNLDSWDAKLFGRHWGGLHQPRHLFFWDPRSFEAFVRRAGFAEVSITPVLQPAHWAISLQNIAIDKIPRLRRWLRNGRLPLYTLAVLAATPLSLLQNLAQKPSIMAFRLRVAD